jgi:hypothetical protein
MLAATKGRTSLRVTIGFVIGRTLWTSPLVLRGSTATIGMSWDVDRYLTNWRS